MNKFFEMKLQKKKGDWENIYDYFCYEKKKRYEITINYSTVTDLARFLGKSTSTPFKMAR